MKITCLLIALLFSTICYSQTLELNISTPQPRLGESFSITVDIDTVAKNVFAGLSNKFTMSTYTSASNETSRMGISLVAKRLGKNEVGPLELTINGKRYSTNKLTFDVVDSLPPVNKGLWLRTMSLNDSTTYIIIEQRIPALTYLTHDNHNSISMTIKTDDENKEIEMVQEPGRINFSGSRSSMQSVKDLKNEKLDFEYFFALYEITLNKNGKPVIVTKNDFKNIPDYYKFKDIIIN